MYSYEIFNTLFVFLTGGDDLYEGAEEVKNTYIWGFSGDDTIETGSGDDVIFAGSGNDRIFAGDGDDLIVAGSGNDLIRAGLGSDIVFAGSGNDSVSIQGSHNLVYLGEGDDSITVASTDDYIDLGDGDDAVVYNGVFGEASKGTFKLGEGADFFQVNMDVNNTVELLILDYDPLVDIINLLSRNTIQLEVDLVDLGDSSQILFTTPNGENTITLVGVEDPADIVLQIENERGG